MIFENTYYFGQKLRWSLGLPSPNFTAAVIVTVIPILWAFCTLLSTKNKQSSVWGWIIVAWYVVIEGGAVYLLFKTYSRGAFVALIVALVVYHAFLAHIYRKCKIRNANNGRNIWRPWGGVYGLVTRVALIGILIYGTGFGVRIGSSGGIKDASSANRIEFWKACLEMISCEPMSGWGGGEAGRAYMNWFQGPNRSEYFITPVNSYLHVAVEHGLPVLFVVLFVIALLVLVGARAVFWLEHSSLRRAVAIACSISIVGAWCTANIFTTLWTQPYLWTVPSVAFAYLVVETVVAFRTHWSSWPIINSLGLSLASSLGLVVAGHQMSSGRLVNVSLAEHGGVLLSKRGESGDKALAWLDPLVLGLAPGKELRRWLLAESRISQIEAATDDLRSESLPVEIHEVLLFGRHSARIGLLPVTSTDVWIIHPTGAVPGPLRAGFTSIHVILPQIDESGDAFRWANWAKNANCEILVSRGCGQDVRLAWPMIAVAGRSPNKDYNHK